MSNCVPLIELRAGDVAEIGHVDAHDDLARRLAELGIRRGAVVEVVRGGSPCIVRVGGSKLCIRDDELLRVTVALRKSA